MNLLQKLFQKSVTWTAVKEVIVNLELVFVMMVGLETTVMCRNVIKDALPTGCVQMELAFEQMDGMENTSRQKAAQEIAMGMEHAQ